MTTLRKLIFWLHLGCGLVAGVVIAIMSVTGIAIAFEHEITDWLDRDVARVSVPTGASRQTLAQLDAALAAEQPGFKPTLLFVPRDPAAAYTYRMGRERMLFVDPYTGTAATPRSGTAHDVLHELMEWHRWLGQKDGLTSTGRLVTGVSNVAFLGLCLTGLYLWFPRRWSRRAFRPLLWCVGRYRGKARDFNWHNVAGFWSLPVLVILAATGVVISFGWGHDLVFRVFGETPPAFRDGRMLSSPAPALPARPPAAAPLTADELLAVATRAFPGWESVVIPLPVPPAPTKPVELLVFEPALFSTAGRIQVHLDPFRGEVLQQVAFADRSPGIRARVWTRFLHTGEAFGLAGKIIATLATAASLVLVWTGFALSWRRFFPRQRAPRSSA
jgi:uncharacterized iron-regulated membrane protein